MHQNGDRRWIKKLPEMIERCLRLATRECEDAEDIEGKRKMQCFENDHFSIDVRERPGYFDLNVYLVTADGDCDVDNPALSLTVKPHQWWMDSLETLAKEKRATVEKRGEPAKAPLPLP